MVKFNWARYASIHSVEAFVTFWTLESLCNNKWVFLFFKGANPDCPRGWMQHSSYCYYVSSTSLSWQDAQAYCNGLGAELVKITSEEENDFVLALARRDATTRGLVWIGLLWSSTSEDFFWSDLSEPVYKNWAENRPRNRDDLPCSVMRTNVDTQYPSGHWNDRECEINQNFQCGIVCKRLP